MHIKKGFALKSDLHAHLDQIASLTFLAIIRIKMKIYKVWCGLHKAMAQAQSLMIFLPLP